VSTFRYPVTLDLERRPCLVVGGGAVAEGKVIGLLEAGARVTVLSPTLSERLLALASDGQFRWQPREFTDGDTEAFFLVIGATDDAAVNRAVAADARGRGALVNCADDAAGSDFILPALLRRGPLTVAVSTGGASPTMACLVRDELDATLSGDYARLTEVVAEVRRTLRDRGLSLDGRRWAGGLDEEVRRLVADGRPDDARQRLLERLGG
jgi:precorrin-2 dehydrogenase/sirohydrochlorin ferrochelatase